MDAGYALSTCFPIVENIFKYLNHNELELCAQVCNLWKTAAEIEKNRRQDDIVSFFHVFPRTDPEQNDVEEDLSEELIHFKPRFCLAFASDYLASDFEQLLGLSDPYPFGADGRALDDEEILERRVHTKVVLKLVLKEFLPKKCQSALIVAPGIIGCHEILFSERIDEDFGISGIMIPFVRDLHIFNFPIDENSCNISEMIPEDMKIKCLLAFPSPRQPRYFYKIMESCISKTKSEVAVSGAIQQDTEARYGSVIAFCGDGVEAASIFIKSFPAFPHFRPMDTEADVEKKLKLFRKTGLLKYRCFAFMFTSANEGHNYRKKSINESAIFRKLYPEVPLIGMFGYGEIGVDYLPNVPCKYKRGFSRIKKLIGFKKTYAQTFSTSFVLIALKM